MAPSTLFGLGSAVSTTGYSLFGPSVGTYVPQTPQSTGLAGLQTLQSQNTEAEAAAQDAQAQVAIQEGNRAASQKAQEANQFASQQALDYSGVGISLPESPSGLLAINRTRQLAQQEVNAISARAGATSSLLRAQGGITRNTGRAALLGQSLDFYGQQTKAKLADLQSRGNRLPSALSSLSSVFGNSLSDTTNPFLSDIWNSFKSGLKGT